LRKRGLEVSYGRPVREITSVDRLADPRQHPGFYGTVRRPEINEGDAAISHPPGYSRHREAM